MDRPVVFDFVARDRNYTGPLRRMEGRTVRFGTTLGRVSGVAVRAFGGIGVAAVGVGVAGATMGIKTAAGLEQAQIAFTQMLGSGRKAQKFLGDLKTFAARTPFELPGLIDSARGLLGVGVEASKVIPILTDLGDAAGALGLDQERFQRVQLAVTQSMAKGKIQAEELMQITEAGVPVWQLLSKALHKPVPELQKLVSQGKLAADDVFPKLFAQMHKDYGGSMAAQSGTLTGLWSTFMDTINLGLADVIKPFEGELKGGLKAAIGTVGTALSGVTRFLADPKTGLVPKIQAFITTHGPQFKTILDGVKRAFETIYNALADPDKGVVPNLEKLRQAWDANKEAIIGFQNAIPGANTLLHAMGTAVHRALEEVTGLGKLILGLGALASLGAQAVRVAFDAIGIAALKVQGFFQTLVINFLVSLRTLAGVVDKLLGTHLASTLDGALKQMRTARADTQAQVDKLKADATTRFRELQREIDNLHGKKIDVSAELKLNFSPSFTQKDWVAVRLAAGRMASGGLLRGPGGPKGDRIPILASDREFMQPADAVAHYGVPFMEAVRKRKLPRFAAGGPVGTIDAESRAVNKVEAWGAGRWLDAGTTALLRKFAAGSAAIKAFLRSADPLPYIWGGAGPGGYDCSGLASAVFGLMTGRGGGHGQRYFTTASNFGALGFRPGPGGIYTIGVNAAGGHMAGRYGGLAFEAANTRAGIRVGAAARGVGTFPAQYHMAKGGLVEAIQAVDWLARQGAVIGGDPARLRVLDQGGWLMPGEAGVNLTSRPELVLPPGASSSDRRALANAIVDAMARAGVGAVYLDGSRVDTALESAHARNARRVGGVTR
jgi:tape measure domain-containing protein